MCKIHTEGGSIMKLKRSWIVIVLTAAAACAALALQNSAQHEVLFEKAKFTMETKGDLKGAIELFDQIIKKYPNVRDYAAKSLYLMGTCCEKLGEQQAQQARSAFQRIVSDYSDQTAEVMLAKQKLATIAEASEEQASRPTFRKISIPGMISEGAQLSADGSKLAFASEGDLWIVNLRGRVSPDIAGEPVRLTRGARAAWGGLSWSKNGEWIAFNHTQGTLPSDIYAVPTSGGEPRKLPISVSPRGGSPTKAALSFSADGSQLAYSTEFEGKLALHMATVATGDDVKRLADPISIDPAFSPNGKFIAYIRSWEVKPYDQRSEVRVLRLADQSDVRFTEMVSTRARSPVWSPDGKLLAFLILPGQNDRTREVWIAPVSETGKADTMPTKISLPNTTYNSLAGWTADNKIGLLFPSPSYMALYTVPLSGGRATQVAPEDSGISPQWSPDGERIYFRGESGPAYVPASGGEVSVIPQSGKKITEASPGGGNHISPDGKRIVFSGGQVGIPGVHLWIMPVTGGEPVRLPMRPDLNAWQPRWSPDGKWIAFESERYDVPGDRKLDENIFIVSSEGGEARQLTNHTDCFCELEAWSPTGDSIAYACTDQIIRIIPFKGGEPRVVLRADGLNSNGGSLAWTRDGNRLLYAAKGRIWTVSASGGEPEAINTGINSFHLQFALSPDGSTIAFNAASGGQQELWLMEDFLSLVKR